MATMGTVIEGLPRPDGTLVLDAPPQVPPGRVQPLMDGRTHAERLPDVPWLEDGIAAPFDLPRPGLAARVQPRAVLERFLELPTEIVEIVD